MTTIALLGDATTTTALALHAAWPAPSGGADVMVVELDPSGGSLAAWLDTPVTPSLSTVAAALHSDRHGDHPGGAPDIIDHLVQRAAGGVRFIPAPFRAVEARGAVERATPILLPTLSQHEDVIALVDVGRVDSTRLPDSVRHASRIAIGHRQDRSSARAAGVRLERLAELVAACAHATSADIDVILVGDRPFGIDEVGEFLGFDGRCFALAVDPLAAAVLAGRQGVSAKRLARLPLLRTAAMVARALDGDVAERRSSAHAVGAVDSGGGVS